MSEETAPYGAGPVQAGSAGATKIRIHHLQQYKTQGTKWAMLTAYDQFAAQIFDEAGIPALLVGDSASNNVLANSTSIPVTVDELLPLVRAVSRSVKRAHVVADLPFGSYQASPAQAFDTAVRFMKEGGAHAVKLEGGTTMVNHIRLLTDSGIPVMGHLGFTPQSEHALGGYRVQGRGEQGQQLLAEAKALENAGAYAVVLEMVPAPIAKLVTESLNIPTIGIGAGADCDAQVLVWQDMMGLRSESERLPRFVKKYANLREIMSQAAQAYANDVSAGVFPAEEHSFQD